MITVTGIIRHSTNIVLTCQVLFLTSASCVCSSSRLVPSYLHHGTQRGVQSMGPIFIPRDLNIEFRKIHWKSLLQENGVLSLEIL